MPTLNLIFRGSSSVLSWPTNHPDKAVVDTMRGPVSLADMDLEESYRITDLIWTYNIKIEGGG